MKVVSFFVLGINIAFAQQTIPFITERTNNVEVQEEEKKKVIKLLKL